MGPTRCGSALADLDDAFGPRAAWSSPGAPHRGGGLLASEPGLVTGTHDLARTIGAASAGCPPVGTGMSRSETGTRTRRDVGPREGTHPAYGGCGRTSQTDHRCCAC